MTTCLKLGRCASLSFAENSQHDNNFNPLRFSSVCPRSRENKTVANGFLFSAAAAAWLVFCLPRRRAWLYQFVLPLVELLCYHRDCRCAYASIAAAIVDHVPVLYGMDVYACVCVCSFKHSVRLYILPSRFSVSTNIMLGMPLCVQLLEQHYRERPVPSVSLTTIIPFAVH